LLAGLSVGVAVAGILVGWMIHRDRRDPALGAVGIFFERAWYINDVYDVLIVRPAKQLAGWLAGPIDQGLIDAAVNGVGRLLEAGGVAAGRLQTGYARQYALVLFIGAILVVGYWVFR
jgi:NADH-quinone oxidoreductase subunit L